MSKMPSVQEVANLHDLQPNSAVGQAQHGLFQRYGFESVIPLLVQAFPLVRRAFGRHSILFWLVRTARVREDVVQLALSALRDKSYLVRSEACGILAYSLREDVIAALASLQQHKDPKTR